MTVNIDGKDVIEELKNLKYENTKMKWELKAALWSIAALFDIASRTTPDGLNVIIDQIGNARMSFVGTTDAESHGVDEFLESLESKIKEFQQNIPHV